MRTLNFFIIFLSVVLFAGFLYLTIYAGQDRYEERNNQRKKDIQSTFQSLQEYRKEDSTILSKIPTGVCSKNPQYEICRTGAKSCKGLVDISELTKSARFLTAIPTDPTGISENGAGYYIVKDSQNTITVCAPWAEKQEITISDNK